MLNHTAIQGRLVADPTFGQTSGGTDYANFRIAWSEKYREKETKCFLECKAFSGTAQFMQKYMNQKGQELIAEGKLTTDEWTTNDGQKRSKIVMVVNAVHFCGKKAEGGESTTAPADEAAPDPSGFEAVNTDELPF